MAKHYRVSPKYWKGARRKWEDRKKLLGLYLLTCEHRNLEGYYFLPKGYIQTDLNWPAKAVADLLQELERDGFVRYDEAAEVVFVVNALAHQSPSTENQIRGAVAALQQVPSASLWDEFRVTCGIHAPKLADAIRIAWPSHANGSLAPAYVPAPTHSSSSISSSTPPCPPTGGRQRSRDRWETNILDWCRSVGVDGDDQELLRAAGQAKPWQQNGSAAEHFRAFVSEHFPRLETT